MRQTDALHDIQNSPGQGLPLQDAAESDQTELTESDKTETAQAKAIKLKERLLRDPIFTGFVPSFLAGNVFACSEPLM